MIRRLSVIALTALLAGQTAVSHAQDAEEGFVRNELGFVGESGDEKTTVVIAASTGVTPIVNPIEVTITVDTLPWYLVTFPNVREEWGAFKVVKEIKTRTVPITGSGSRLDRSERRYVLEPMEPGFHSLPTMLISVLDGSKMATTTCLYREECEIQSVNRRYSNSSQFLRTAPIGIEITSVLPPDADITKPKDILPPVALPRPPPTPLVWQPYALSAAGLLVALLLGFWLWKLLTRAPAPKPVPMAPAHELALAALARLEGMAFATPEEADAFHVRLSAIFRRYLDWRFGIQAGERTTEEVVSAVAEPEAASSMATRRDLMQSFLRKCDQVKFARYQPGGDESRGLLTSATDFVQETADANARVAMSRATEVA
jgi:hypothetical protein